MRLKRFLIIPFLICFSLNVKAQIAVEATADTNRILIGEPIPLSLSVKYNSGVSIKWPVIPEQFQVFEKISEGSISSHEEGGNVIEQKKLTITSFDTGWHVIEPFTFLYSLNNNWDSIKTEPILVHVATVAVDTTQEIRPLKGILEIEKTWRDYIPHLLIAIALIIGALLFWWWYKKRKVKPEPQVQPVAERIPFSIWAIQQLDKLEAQYSNNEVNVKEFYIKLSEVIRKYLLELKGIDTLEMTTRETIDAIKEVNFNREATHLLQEILTTADMAKFAKSEPTERINKEMLQHAREVINLTKPTPAKENNERI